MASDSGTRTLISQAQLQRGRGRFVYWTLLGLTVLVFTLVFLGPLYWMVTGALKSGQEIAQTPPSLFPQDPQVQNYVDAWTNLKLATLMIPAMVLIVPQYVAVIDLPILGINLLDSPFAIWLPLVANAFNIFLLKRFFDSIPEDLMAAAVMDGATPLR